MMDFSEPIVNHFVIFVNQAIMLYALNLYSDVCQLFLNKTGDCPGQKYYSWQSKMHKRTHKGRILHRGKPRIG